MTPEPSDGGRTAGRTGTSGARSGTRTGRRRPAVRLAGLALLVAVIVSFVVENDQKVKVQLWFVTGHPRLVWVLAVTVLVSAVLGYLYGRTRRRRRLSFGRGARRRGRSAPAEEDR